jgi:hypothetical protein
MADYARTLLRTAGWTDAALTPIRDWTAPRPTNRYELQEMGIPHRSGGTEGERQRGARSLEDAINAGLLAPIKSATKTLRLKLTAQGFYCASALIDSRAEDSLVHMREMSRLIETHRGWGVGPGRQVNETLLAGIDAAENYKAAQRQEGREALGGVMFELRWAFFFNWIGEASDRRGRTWYDLRPAGRAVLSHGFEHPAVVVPEFDPDEAWEFYAQERRAAYSHIADAKPIRANELGFIPCSTSVPALRPAAAKV